MVVVSALKYAYGTEKTLLFPDFGVDKGSACLILGNSGSGKTTLLHLMGGLLKIHRGRVEIRGRNLGDFRESELDRFRGKHMGFIFQRSHLIPALSVKENLLMAPFLANLPQNEERVESVLTELGLLEKRDAGIATLSQGQAQRVAIARAIVNKPAVIFADEPTSALDDNNCEKVIRLLLNVSVDNGSTLIVATHDQRLKSHIPKQIFVGNHQ